MKIVQTLLKALEDKVNTFLKFMSTNVKPRGNMDKTPMTFDLPSTYTVNVVGGKQFELE